MRTLNLDILAHVDAGKTTLTERLLYAAGVIDEIGSVDDGSTQTDSLELERLRGITIKSAVVSFVVPGTSGGGTSGNVTVNLIDTPGHPDFIAEVERILSVLDGAVLVISAVEGVQPQTRLLMRALQRLRIPTIIFVNKIDRAGAQDETVLQAISEKLTPAIVSMGSARDLGTRGATFLPHNAVDVAFRTSLADALAEHNEAVLAEFVDDEDALSCRRLRQELAEQTNRALVHPVLFGSAITGAGVDPLIAAIEELLPAAEGDADGPVSGVVFKVERGAAGEKIAYVRMFSGEVRMRDRLRSGLDGDGKVTAINVFDRDPAVRRPSVVAGQIAKLWGLPDVQIGDTIGEGRKLSERHFALPTLETVVVPARPSDKGALHVALAQLAEQDPLIDLRQDDFRQELFVSLYGEVQKEVIQATLSKDFGIDVGFRETRTICIERPTCSGAAVELIRKNPFLATIGLRIDPAAANSGVGFRLDVEVRSIPLYIYKSAEEFRDAMEGYVQQALRQGLHGWPVTDCTVTMTESDYLSPGSKAQDFRKLTPLVLMSALRKAGTVVCEPMHSFHLEIPADTLGPMLPALARLGAVPRPPTIRDSSCTLEGEIPAARMHELQLSLPALTRGEGVVECAFERYEAVRGRIPIRPRYDHNPLNRKEYLMHAGRRV